MRENLTYHAAEITTSQRAAQKGQQACVLWFTGLSGAGKSTISNMVEAELYRQGHHSYLLDGDNVRLGLNADLSFSDSDRKENIRRVGEVAKLMSDAGLIVLSAFISPFASERQMVRDRFEKGEFIEIHIDTPLSECEARDPKGLYKKARAGQIKNFTGIDSTYEAPPNPEVYLDGSQFTAEQCAQKVVEYLTINGWLNPKPLRAVK